MPLSLGSRRGGMQGPAQGWARALVTPPPSLAHKLGISCKSRVLVIGEPDSDELNSTVAEAAVSDAKDPELVLAYMQTELDLDRLLERYALYKDAPPVWIIYAKGPKSSLGESRIRTTLRSEGFMDTKISSVSYTLTALRFIKRS